MICGRGLLRGGNKKPTFKRDDDGGIAMKEKIEKFSDFWSSWTPIVLSLLRIMSALVLLQHGMSKILKFPHNPNYDNLKIFSLIWFAGMLELVFGSLLTLGLFTRVAAFVLSGEMAFAYF